MLLGTILKNKRAFKMPNMSYFLTTKQFIENKKDVTRRIGWTTLKDSDTYTAVLKSQGLKTGEKITKLGECMCISNAPEQLDEIIRNPYRDGSKRSEMEREGFPDMTAEQFVNFFCKHMKVSPKTVVNRIEFMKMPWASTTYDKQTKLVI